MVPFPLAKLGYLGIKQISRPVSARIKSFAVSSHVFRRFVCVPVAQLYHRMETISKLILMGFGKPQKVKPLTEEMAVTLGADILGEMVVFGIAAGTMIFEYNRGAASAAAKTQEVNDRLERLELRSQELGIRVQRQKAMIRELRHDLDDSNSTIGRLKSVIPGVAPTRSKSLVDIDDDDDDELQLSDRQSILQRSKSDPGPSTTDESDNLPRFGAGRLRAAVEAALSSLGKERRD